VLEYRDACRLWSFRFVYEDDARPDILPVIAVPQADTSNPHVAPKAAAFAHPGEPGPDVLWECPVKPRLLFGRDGRNVLLKNAPGKTVAERGRIRHTLTDSIPLGG
jgi:hypothetical protein